jgi:hypothetical protein
VARPAPKPGEPGFIGPVAKPVLRPGDPGFNGPVATKQESREKTAMEVLTDPKFLISNGVNLNKNAMRAKSTLDGAAQRHGIRSENALLKARLGEMDALKAEQAGDPAEAATLRAQSDQALDRALKEEGLAAHYQGKVQQLTDLTKPHPPGTPVLDRLGRPLGNVPPVVQKALGTSVFDHMNRPAVPGQSAVKNALPFLRESTFGGDNAMELARRGLTKLGGVATVAFAARDVYKDVQAGDSVPRALVKTGSGRDGGTRCGMGRWCRTSGRCRSLVPLDQVRHGNEGRRWCQRSREGDR